MITPKTIIRRPGTRNAQLGTTYINASEEPLILSGEISFIEVHDSFEDVIYTIPAIDAYNALLDQERIGQNNQLYRVFNFRMLVNKPQSKTHFTQVEIADQLGIGAERISELHHFDFLQPIGKQGLKYIYDKVDIDKALREPKVQYWLKCLKKEIRCSPVKS